MSIGEPLQGFASSEKAILLAAMVVNEVARYDDSESAANLLASMNADSAVKTFLAMYTNEEAAAMIDYDIEDVDLVSIVINLLELGDKGNGIVALFKTADP